MMKIVQQKNINVHDLIQGYINDVDTGQVSAYNGRLNVRPAYQREFVWDKGSATGGRKQQALIDSIMNNFPINVMYWVKIGQNQDGEDMFECLDGQQRIITMCKFRQNEFGMADGTQFDGLTENTRFLDYDMFTIYVCEADTLEEKLSWFERINTAGEPLVRQEMRSAIACGTGTTLAKKYFVSTKNDGTNAYSFDAQSGRPGRDYVKGEWDRQAIYEKVIIWRINSKNDDEILAYMKNNREKTAEATALFEYFKNVITWVKRLFTTYDKDMASVEWGFLYNLYHSNTLLSPITISKQIAYLKSDIGRDGNSHLESSKGIYEFVLAIDSGVDEKEAQKLLNRRAFSDKDKKAQYERQRHVCPHCLKKFNDISMMAGDHMIPYSPIPSSGQLSGPTTSNNLQMLCNSCNLDKSNRPFDKAAEEKRLQDLYSLTDAEVAKLPEAKLD